MAKMSLTKILLVEDEPDIQVIAKMTLELVGGFSVELCNSGHEALRKAPGFHPDLILLDVMMPDLDGPDTLRALRLLPNTTSIPVIFMTARVQPYEVVQYKLMGALDVIAKPFDPMTLPALIIQIWSKAYA